MQLASATTSSALWYLTRGAGAVSLLLLTASVLLGIANVTRWRSTRWPRFALGHLHRNVSLLVLVLLGVHVATAVVDGFAPIALVDAVIPFGGRYRPIWLGLGALAFDLLLALVATSLLRRRLGLRAWRRVHWLAYGSWPVALVHGFGTGSDARSAWFQLLSAACLGVVIVTIWARLASAPREYRGRRALAVAATVLVPAVLLAWLPAGPLANRWSRRAGTPSSILSRTAGGARQH